MRHCHFVSDLHGRAALYERLFEATRRAPPLALFLGGDLLPSGLGAGYASETAPPDFLDGFLAPRFRALREELGDAYREIAA